MRRHARARARVHRPDQDRERGVDRRQPPPHRSGHRRRTRSRASTTKRCSCASSPTSLKVAPAELPDRVARLARAGEASCRTSSRPNGRSRRARKAARCAADAVDGVVVLAARRPAPRRAPPARDRDPRRARSRHRRVVGLGPDGAKAGLAVAVSKDLVAARRVGGRDRARRGAGARWRHREERRARRRWRAERRRGRRRARAPRRAPPVPRGAPGARDCARREPRARRRSRHACRIGLAASDPSGTLASPLAVLDRSGDEADDHRAIVAAARERRRRRGSWSACPARCRGKIGPGGAVGAGRGRALSGSRAPTASPSRPTMSASPRSSPSRGSEMQQGARAREPSGRASTRPPPP